MKGKKLFTNSCYLSTKLQIQIDHLKFKLGFTRMKYVKQRKLEAQYALVYFT